MKTHDLGLGARASCVRRIPEKAFDILEEFGFTFVDMADAPTPNEELIFGYLVMDIVDSQKERTKRLGDSFACTSWSKREILVRRWEPWIVAHEVGHVLDFAFGEQIGGDTPYRAERSTQSDLHMLWERAKRPLSPQAAKSPAEMFAEAFRAWIGENDGCTWAPITRRDVRDRLPPLAEIFTVRGVL